MMSAIYSVDGPLPIIIGIAGFLTSLGAVVFWRPHYEVDPLPVEVAVTTTGGFNIGGTVDLNGQVFEIISVDRHRRRLTLIPR